VGSIAVLPFADMSAQRDQDHLCEGLAEEIAAALSRVPGLRVAARSSSFQFRGPAGDAREVGRRLRVAHLLEGSVRKDGDRLRISVQLVEADTGYHRWSQRFDRRLGDVFAVQEEIAASVASALGGVLTRSEMDAPRPAETRMAAYEVYLRGRQYLHRMRRPDIEQSRELFERAIELDPAYAPAWAGLATVHATLYEWWGARDEDLERADRASRMALAASPDLAESHVARGVALSLGTSYEAAATEFAEAIRINPHLFDAYYYAARSSFAAGEIERSAELFRAAAAARQEDLQSAILLAQSLWALGRDAEAAEANREGIARAERVLALNPFDGRALWLGASALFVDGQRERAFEWSDRALALYPDDMSALVNGACLRSQAGDKEAALDMLERLFARGWGKRDWIEHDPDYDPLRGDPRFQRLLAGLK
jgi:TolB-like protein/tetratricopeptide (TPR) repeat protein